MRFALGLVTASLVSSLAHADATFEEYAAAVGATPAHQLQETACDVDIQLRGAVAMFEIRQRIVNTGSDALAGHFETALPRSGRVTYFAWKHRGALDAPREVALPVRSDSPTVTGGTPGITGFDPATLFARGDAAAPGYQIVMQPLAAGDEAHLTTRYVALADVRAGALELRLPSRKSTGRLAACRANLIASPGPGATVTQIRINERVVRGARASFVLDDVEVTLAADLAIAGDVPVAWSQTQPLANGYSATLLTVLGPVTKPRGAARRIVFVVDGSKSMELVGRHHVTAVVERIARTLPAGSEIEAIVYDRKVTRVFGELRPASEQNVEALTKLLASRASTNGSDIVGAFQMAKQVIEGTRGETTLVVITDGVTPELERTALVKALAAKPSRVDERNESVGGTWGAKIDVHAIVIDPASTQSPGHEILRAPVNMYGGAFVEVSVDEIATALQSINEWMRPSWLELGLAGYHVPTEVRAGGGFTHAIVHKTKPRLVITGHSDRPFTIAERPAPSAPIAMIADLTDGDLSLAADREGEIAKIRATHPIANATTMFAVLAPTGRIAKDRRAVTKGGGRYDRVIALADPQSSLGTPPTTTAPTASAIARATLERMFRDQLQPKAYVCYQRALGTNAKLAGTVQFSLLMGRGEVTEVKLVGLGDAGLDQCLLEAAYTLTPPAPDFRVNADDQTIANYPIAFTRKDEKTEVVLGDADSTSPIDIDAIEKSNDKARAAARKKRVEVDAKTPLGGMKAPKSP